MNPFSLWWANNRRWLIPLLLVVGLVVVVGTFAQTTNYLTGWMAQRHAVKRTSQLLSNSAKADSTDKAKQRDADKNINNLDGQQKEQHRASQQSKHDYEKATAELPVIAELPRNPPRYRPSSR